MRSFRRLWLSACFVLLACVSYAQEIDLIGRTGWYHYTRRLLAIYADLVENNRPSITGPLYLTVHATETPSGGDFTGSYVIGSLPLGQLRGQWSIEDINNLARYYPPPPGLYYTSMVLEEYYNGAYDVIDFEDLPGIVNFGAWGEGFGTGLGANNDVSFEGDVSWLSENGLVRLSADLIANDRSTRTKPLRLRLYATDTPYDGGQLTGVPLATKKLARLKPGFGFQDYSRVARFRPPAEEGTYYTVLTVEERIGKNWYILDYVVFPEPSIF